MIMADDIGVENLSCYGATAHKTPNPDALAAGDIRFNHAHSQPICTPSRVQIMTGIYNNRNYVQFGLLDPEAVTFGNVLRDAGYTTAIAGKWQLKGGFEGVANFGFDHHCLWQLTRRPSRYPMIMPHWPFVPTPDHPDWDPEMWKDAIGEPGGYKGPEYWDAFVSYTDKMVGQLKAVLAPQLEVTKTADPVVNAKRGKAKKKTKTGNKAKKNQKTKKSN